MLEGRRAWVLWALLGLASIVTAHLASAQEVRVGGMKRSLPHALDTLARAGMVLTSEGVAVPGGLPVEVVQGSGEAWERELVVEAVEEHEAFRNAKSSHLIRVETIRGPNAHALQLRLSRMGWDVMLPAAVQRRAQPVWFVLAAFLGLAVAMTTRRVSLAFLAAALASALVLMLVPIAPPLLGYPALEYELRAAPLWTAVSSLMAAAERYLSALVAAVIVFCGLLAYFDHRASKDSPDSLTAPRVLVDALLISLSALILVETATRSGFVAAIGALWGTLSALGLLGACVVAFLRAKQPGAASS